jgi:diadenosine tetraphosphate (Ap4A) HIT family hydrolase
MKNKYVDIENVRNEDMRRKWEQIIHDGVDPFDRANIEQYTGSEIVYESAHWYSIENDHAYAGTQHQIVIISKKFHTDMDTLSLEEWNDYLAHIKTIKKMYLITGGGLTMRFGDTEISGATVRHLHGQLIIPKKGKAVAAWFGHEKEE